MKTNKRTKRQKVRYRIRKTVSGSVERPRLSVFKSNKAIYCQVIDDIGGQTLFEASSLDKTITKATKTEQAKEVGKLIAKKVTDGNISSVVFDRGGFLYHGRVKALADGAREGGLQF
ncbi:MAG: 50S ribosomal protein L18 [Bacteroidota bacterium]|nr:50S ribosomal protein L18 [Bacteroidota bacterium]